MSTRTEKERILFYNLMDRAQGHAFALMTVSCGTFNNYENDARHKSLVSKLKRRDYEVYEFAARIENSDGTLQDPVSLFAFVIDDGPGDGTSAHSFTDEMFSLFDPFDGGKISIVHSIGNVTCHEDIGSTHRVFLTKKVMGDRDVVAYERRSGDGSRAETFGDEALIAWRMVIETKIRAFPEDYHNLEYARGYDAYVHWREMYEDALGIDARRTALEQIALDTEFFDAALIGVDFIPGALENAERKDISLRAFLRSGWGKWGYWRLNSRFKGYDPDLTPVKLWYVRDNGGHSIPLLPRLYRKAMQLGITSFFWITAFGPVGRVDVIEPLPEDITTKEALALLVKRGHYDVIACGGTTRHPKKIPKRINEFFLGNQFANDRRPEIHGIAENHSRALRDQRLDQMNWQEIELNEVNRR